MMFFELTFPSFSEKPNPLKKLTVLELIHAIATPNDTCSKEQAVNEIASRISKGQFKKNEIKSSDDSNKFGNQCTMLEFFAKQDLVNIVGLLIKAGANLQVYLPDTGGSTLSEDTMVHSLLRYGKEVSKEKLEIIKLLVTANNPDCKISKKSYHDCTVFHLLANKNINNENVKNLIDFLVKEAKKENIDKPFELKNDYGNTLLHLAAKLGNKDLIEYVVSYKPDESVKNSDGNTYKELFPVKEEKKLNLTYNLKNPSTDDENNNRIINK